MNLRKLFHPLAALQQEGDAFVDKKIREYFPKPVIISAIVYLVIFEIAVVAIAAALLKIAFF
ncbi:MAG: hypothetical protein MJ033_01070 [Victivallaceae bacterium]|nr:hypothetical protein [Victivallaceae bacterium]